MSKQKVVVAGTNGISAQQMSEFYRQIGAGEIDGKVMQAILEHQNPWSRSWTEKDNILYFTLPATDGTTGEAWIPRLENKGYRLSNCTKQLLLSNDFKPTKGKVNYVKVFKGDLFSDENRVTEKIREEAKKCNLTNLNAEIACLIRENFSDEELKAMGLMWLVVMHEPIKDSVGEPYLLGVYRNGDGRWSDAYSGRPSCRWNRGSGFAFATEKAFET